MYKRISKHISQYRISSTNSDSNHTKSEYHTIEEDICDVEDSVKKSNIAINQDIITSTSPNDSIGQINTTEHICEIERIKSVEIVSWADVNESIRNDYNTKENLGIYKQLNTMVDDTPIVEVKNCESISFSGGGYNCVYHLGVVRYIFENPEIFKNFKYLGASGGASIGGLILCYINDVDRITVLTNIITDIAEMKQEIPLSQQVARYIDQITQYIDEDRFNKFILGNKLLYISVTEVTNMMPRNYIKSSFDSYSDYLKYLNASACIPILLDDRVRSIGDRYFLDGGLSNNMPVLNQQTIKISCLNYPFLVADIYPEKSSLKYAFYHPGQKYIMEMYGQGYIDMHNYMKNYIEKINRIKIQDELNKAIQDFINFDDDEINENYMNNTNDENYMNNTNDENYMNNTNGENSDQNIKSESIKLLCEESEIM